MKNKLNICQKSIYLQFGDKKKIAKKLNSVRNNKALRLAGFKLGIYGHPDTLSTGLWRQLHVQAVVRAILFIKKMLF